MNVSFGLPVGVRRAAAWLCLLTTISMKSGAAWAEKPLRDPTDQAAGVTTPATAPDTINEITQRIWSILDVVERQHISAPSRPVLWKIVAPVLSYPGETASLDKLVDEFARCASADEFTARFRKRWEAMNRPPMAHDQLPSAIVTALAEAKHLGPLRLMRAKDYAVEEQFRGNRYVGLGVNLQAGKHSQLPQFVKVLPGGAAERGGLKDGVTVLEVDGRATRDVPTETLLDWLRGPAGSDVTLKAIPAGNDAEQTVTLTRGLVRFDSVFTTNREPVRTGRLRFNPAEPIGLLVISGITGSTLQELRDAEVRLRAEGVRALVLDFQSSQQSDNFHQARLVADGLLDGGTLWHWHERNAEPRVRAADRECLFRGMPLLILVDPSTGAAHAAIAAALQDAGRAIIVGQSPAFDGAIPSGVTLSDGQQVLWLNTARLTRAGANRSWPLIPDHPITSVAMTPTPIIVQKQGVARQAPAVPPQVAIPKQRLIVEVAPEQRAVRNRVVETGDGSVSALTPSNLTQNEISLRMRQTGLFPNVTQQLEQQQRMIDMTNLRTSAMQTAQQIARDLLKKSPPSS